MSPASEESAVPRYPVLAHLFAWGFPVALYAICYAIDVARGLS